MSEEYYQIVDSVHGTIYYTKLEKEIINTPFFSRLHDVNQCSTVYLTFPPNRTKRYEHSLGTMQLTSYVFCNATKNSVGSRAMDFFMEKTKEAFETIVAYIKDGGKRGGFIFTFEQMTFETMDYIRRKEQDDINGIIEREFSTLFDGNYLLNYAPNKLNTGLDAFLFLCMLQSLRIVGLLHDLGHPPQSHIIESVLEEIDYEVREIDENNRTTRQKTFCSILSSYRNLDNSSVSAIDQDMAIQTENADKAKLHEMIGVQIVKRVVDYVLPKFVEEAIRGVKKDSRLIIVLYYFSIIEFIFAIFRNKNAFWIGMHGIVDGTIDTDRMDFVPRDSKNSGMLWGMVPYRRLVNTVRFGIVSNGDMGECVCACFSDKNIQQMDDLLTSRYKIFSLINYHHRSNKTAALYKRAVKILADRYLQSSEPEATDDAYFTDINGLWGAIDNAYARGSSVSKWIQWNDSWLNGLLYRCIVEDNVSGSEDDKIGQCRKYLREVFLNEHHHYSLIKRQTEMAEINVAVMSEVSDTIDKVAKEIIAVQEQLRAFYKKIQEDESAGADTISVNNKKKEEAYSFLVYVYEATERFDWEAIEVAFGVTIVSDAVEKVLSCHKDKISSYLIEKIKFSLGTGPAYVYDYKGKVHDYYEYSNIKDVLYEMRLGFPFYHIYLEGTEFLGKDTRFLSELRREIGREIGKTINGKIEKNIDFDATKS